MKPLALLLAIALLAPARANLAPVRPVVTTYGTVSVTDPYRYMEDDRDPAYLAWRDAQFARTSATLHGLPQRPAVEAVAEGLHAAPRPDSIAVASGKLFYEDSGPGGKTIVVFDPRTGGRRAVTSEQRYASPSAHARFGAFGVTPDAKTLAVHVFPGKGRESDIRIVRVADGTDAELPLHHSQFDEIAFTPDSAEFIYGRTAPHENPSNADAPILQYAHR